MVVFLIATALAACPDGSEDPAVLDAHIEHALTAYAAGDSGAYVTAWTRVEVDLACVGKPVPTRLAARFLLLNGVHADLMGDAAESARWFRAARLADPAVSLGESVAGVKPELAQRFAIDEDLPQPSTLPASPGVSWQVDGRSDNIFYEGVPAVVQGVGEDGRVLWTGAIHRAAELPQGLVDVEDFNRGLLSARGYTLILVPGGVFEMAPNGIGGAPAPPARHVEITRPFLIGQTEVTVELWDAVHGHDPAGSISEQRPHRGPTWYDAARFCNALSALEGLDAAYEIDGDEISLNPSARGYRLPTEAEWASAATTFRYAGGDDRDLVAWHKGNSGGQPHLVATKAPTSLGLHDMTGNVAEWVWDSDVGWDDGAVRDPITWSPSRYRVVRGGSFESKGRALRVDARSVLPATRSDQTVGFRIARWLD